MYTHIHTRKNSCSLTYVLTLEQHAYGALCTMRFDAQKAQDCLQYLADSFEWLTVDEDNFSK